jgi:putative tryptophan/tyrosine transport system substrate-binding protein
VGIAWRRLLIVLPVAIVLGPACVSAQLTGKTPRVGYLVITGTGASLREGLRALGYEEGRTIIVELRSAEGHVDRIPALAAELVRLNVDVIVAGGSEALEAARRATSSIPIVMLGLADPVATGLVSSLARPGGNITGLTMGGPEVAGKRLEFLKEAMPGLSRVALLRDPSSDPGTLPEAESAARTLRLKAQILTVQAPADFEGAFAAAKRERAEAIHVNETSMLFAHRSRLADLAARGRLPMVGVFRQSAEAGYLITYGPDMPALFRRTATYVDRILKGDKPGNLPIEQPTKFELAINLKTAKALGLTIPPSVLGRADQVIQ